MSWRQTFISNGFVLVAGLIGGVLSARFLGVDDRGLLAALIFWPHFLVGIMTFGINEAVVVQVARDGVSRLLTSTIFWLSLVCSIVPVVVGICLMPWLLGDERSDSLVFSYTYIIFLAPASFVALNLLSIDQGRLNFGEFNFQRVLQAGLYPLLLVALWALDALNVANAAASVLAGTLLISMLRVWAHRGCILTKPSIPTSLMLLSKGWRIHSVDLLTHFSAQIDKMILIYFSNNAALGLYVVAQTLANAMQGVITQTYINQMLPRAANASDLLGLAVSLKRLVIVSVFVLASVHVVLPTAISVLFGDEFRGAVGVARVLSAAAILAGLKKALVYLLRGAGQNRSSFKSELVAVVIVGLGAFPAITEYGVYGLSCVVALAHACSLMTIWQGFKTATGLSLKRVVRA